MWQSPDPIIGEYISGETNGGVFNPKNLGLFTYTYNTPVNLVDPDGNNPGPVYLKGPLAQIDLKSGNAAIDNTVLGAVNTLFNFSNSVVNSGLNALAAYGDAIAPHEAAIESISSGLGPQAKAGGMAIVASAKTASYIGKLGKISRVKPINGRMPINANKYAGGTVPLGDLPKTIRNKYPHSVSFTGTGFPDFSRYAIKNVRIELGSSRAVDFARADKAAGFSRNNPRPQGYTWHHHQDSGYMQLVPTDIHDAIKHSGGIATSK